MMLQFPRARFLPLLLACAATAPLRAQQLIGYVNTRDADTTGASDVLDGQAVLTGSASVTAKDHTAPITLGRGGTVCVCQTSVLHLTESKTPVTPAPLLFSLDRGAIEIQTAGAPNDAIMTPDLRFSVHNAGPLDLRLRIARNGDTCVDNRGPGAPTLAVSDPFGEAMYEVAPGQHVLFEHGSLHEVVDNETSPCGCPEEKGMSIADALLASPNATSAPKLPQPASAVPAAPLVAPGPVIAVAVPVAAPAPIAQAAAPSAVSTHGWSGMANSNDSGGWADSCACTTRRAKVWRKLFVVMRPKRFTLPVRVSSAALCHQYKTKSADSGTAG